MPVKNPTLS